MKNLLAYLIVLSLSPVLRGGDPPDAQELGTSPSGGLKVLGYQQESGESVFVWVESKGRRADLPPSPMDGGDSWQSSYLPAFTVSPDEQWLCGEQKICVGCSAAYLYRRGKGLAFSIATKTRLDILAWQFFGKSTGIDADALLAAQSTLIDVLALGNRYLAVSLRGAVPNLPPGMNVPKNPEGDNPTGIYGWQCLYDLKQGKFLVTEVMKAHDEGAWNRWVNSDGAWGPDADKELNAAYKGLIATLGEAGRKGLQADERSWLKERDRKVKANTDVASDLDAQRAVELELRRVEAATR